MTHLRLVTIALFALVMSGMAQQRDAAVTPVGSGEIAGVVRSADSPPQPIRRAIVSVTGAPLRGARSVLTDDNGRFVIARLPAGTFTVTARKAAHLEAVHGASRPGRDGSPVALADGQRAEIALTMFKGAVIAGVLRDERGEPLAGVPVTAIDPRGSPGAGMLAQNRQGVTDDRGAYRLYGLAPGAYLVAAAPMAGRGAIASRSADELDALLTQLAQRDSAALPAGGPARVPPARPVGYAPVYFPGTPLHTDAEPIRLQAGEERAGVSFTVTHVPVASIEGTVTGASPDVATIELTIITPAPRSSPFPGLLSASITPPNAQGEFAYRHLPPGPYRIVARARPKGEASTVATPRMGGRAGGGAVSIGPGSGQQYIGEQLWGVADVEMRGQDIRGLALPLQPGGSIAGRVVFDGRSAAPPDDLSGIRVSVSQIGGTYMSSAAGLVSGNALLSVAAGPVASDGTFRITGIGPAQYSLAVQLPQEMRSIWSPVSAIVDGRDLLDELIEGPAIQHAGVVVTLSDRPTGLIGALTSAAGAPVNEYFVVAFSTDRRHWRAGSRRVASARPATDGRFTLAGLPAGEYHVAALVDLIEADLLDAAYLAGIAPAALRLTIAAGEMTVQDLRVK